MNIHWDWQYPAMLKRCEWEYSAPKIICTRYQLHFQSVIGGTGAGLGRSLSLYALSQGTNLLFESLVQSSLVLVSEL